MEKDAVQYSNKGLRRERTFKDPLDPLDISDEQLIQNYRFPRDELLQLIKELEPQLARPTKRNNAIPAYTQVLAALRYYATGEYQFEIAECTGIYQGSVSRIIAQVSDVLAQKATSEIKMPTNKNYITRVMEEFATFHDFPRVIGIIDTIHIAIKVPSVDEHIYVNQKFVHSMNVQVICDSQGKIINYCAKYPGSTEDEFIWLNSSIRKRFQKGEFGDGLLLGDNAYPLEPSLMTPIRTTSTEIEENYNRSHKKTRILIERCFGLLKSRFRCLNLSDHPVMYEPVKCARIIISCFLLHNYCISRNIPYPDETLLYMAEAAAKEERGNQEDETHDESDDGENERDEDEEDDIGIDGKNLRDTIVANFVS